MGDATPPDAHDLDVRCAAPQFFAHRFANGVGAIGDRRQQIGMIRAAATVIQRVIAGPEVAMAAGLRNHASAVEQPGHAIQQSVPDRQRQSDIRATHIAKRGESAIQTAAHKLRGEVRQIGYGRLHHSDNVQSRRVNMNMRVDQPRHQDTAAAIDDLRISRDGSLSDLPDYAAFDDNVHTFKKLFRFAVENTRGSKDDGTRHCLTINQTSPVLRSMVLITESIFPFNTCFAMLSVKPSTTWNGRCDGNDSA